MGLAIGDALGGAIQFSQPGTFEPVIRFRAGGPHHLNAGEWTDDTSMALALAASMAEAGCDLNDRARRYVRWWQHGEYSVNGLCFDMGFTTRAALLQFQQSGDARSSASRAEGASGNGSIMRLALVPIRFVHLFPDRIQDLAVLAAGVEPFDACQPAVPFRVPIPRADPGGIDARHRP